MNLFHLELYMRVPLNIIIICVAVSHQSCVQRPTLDSGKRGGASTVVLIEATDDKCNNTHTHTHRSAHTHTHPVRLHMTEVPAWRLQAPSSSGASSKEPANAQKDDGVFKTPPPPPKVTKCVNIPTDLYQDTVTTLKCRKEHKEVRWGRAAGGLSSRCPARLNSLLMNFSADSTPPVPLLPTSCCPPAVHGRPAR